MSRELMLEKIVKAQERITRDREQVSSGNMRQRYHFMAETGWINDPNGVIYYKGKYHFFYQYNPYHGFWENMHWGHAVSEDMLHWEYLPPALAPSEEYEDHLKGGCFSGSAIEHEGKLYLMYTAAANHGKGFVQTQCIAYSEDGIHFEKYEKNPVLTAPKGVAQDSFRDPKVWRHEGLYYMVCGASKDKKGQALLYRSEDMLQWSFVNVLAESRGEWGSMWECPDFFEIGRRYVLTFSPIGAGERTLSIWSVILIMKREDLITIYQEKLIGDVIIMLRSHFLHRTEEELWLRGRTNGSGCRFLKIGGRRTERAGADFLIYRERLR